MTAEPIMVAPRARADASTVQLFFFASLVTFLLVSAALGTLGAPLWLYLPGAVAAVLVAGLLMGLRAARQPTGPAIAVYHDRVVDLRRSPAVTVQFNTVERWHYQVLTDLGAWTQERTLQIESPTGTLSIGRGILDYRELQESIAQLLPADKLAGVP